MQPSKTWLKIEGHVTAANSAHVEFQRAMADAIHHGLKCGWELLQAKDTIKHGDWVKFCEEHISFSLRTAQRYMQFTAMTMVRIGQRDPKLLNGMRIPARMNPNKTIEVDLDMAGRRADLYEIVQKAALESPVELVALAREVGLLRPFEENPGRARSHAGHDHNSPAKQLCFSFDDVSGALKTCLRLPKITPELRPAPAQLLRLRNDLAKAIVCVDAAIAETGTIDLPAEETVPAPGCNEGAEYHEEANG